MKTCLFCKEPIKGRSDKKYCDDSCRNAFNNNKSANSNNLMRRVNRILSKNRKILKEAYFLNESKSSKETLLFKGFSFGYFTSVYENEEGKKCYFIYELGYCLIDDQEINILKKETALIN